MNWLKGLFSRRRHYNDLSDEMQQHLDEKIAELVASGISRKEAAARREFGNVTLIESPGREVWRWPSIESLLADVRLPARRATRRSSCAGRARRSASIPISATSEFVMRANTRFEHTILGPR